MADEVLTESRDHTCFITLNRPGKRNALNAAMIAQLRAAFERVATDQDARVVVVRAKGPAFCAGLDLREMAAQREAGEADLGGLEKVLEDLEACPQPTIAAVQGDAVAGGFGPALPRDLPVGAGTRRFSIPRARQR